MLGPATGFPVPAYDLIKDILGRTVNADLMDVQQSVLIGHVPGPLQDPFVELFPYFSRIDFHERINGGVLQDEIPEIG